MGWHCPLYLELVNVLFINEDEGTFAANSVMMWFSSKQIFNMSKSLFSSCLGSNNNKMRPFTSGSILFRTT